jgi:hypothetical protein
MDKCPQNKHDLHRVEEEELFCEECINEQYTLGLKEGRKAALLEVSMELRKKASDLFLERKDKLAEIMRDLAAEYLKKT